jgi:hypothetical protein
MYRKLHGIASGAPHKLTQVPEFYDYFDVLGFIDKSIVYIQSFLETLSGDNMSNFFKTRESMIEKIDLEFKSFETLYKPAKELIKDHKVKKKKSSEFHCFEDGLTGFNFQKKFFYERYIKYRGFLCQDYLKSIFLKHNKLICLETYLEKVKGVICPLCEEDFKKQADLFKTTFESIIKEVY